MKIIKLPNNHYFSDNQKVIMSDKQILPVKDGWIFNIFLPGKTLDYYDKKSICYFLNTDGGKAIKEGYVVRLEWGSVLVRKFTQEGMDTYKNAEFVLTPNGEIDSEDRRHYKESHFKNPDYSCFIVNPFKEKEEKDVYEGEYIDNHPVDYMKALLILAGLNSKNKSFALLYHKKDGRVVPFESPLQQPLEGVCPSRDGLTFLMLSKNYAAIIDNPF